MISTMNILSGKQITLSPKQFFMSLLKSSKMKSPIVKQTNYISPQWFLHTVKLNSFSNSTSLFSQPDFFKQLLFNYVKMSQTRKKSRFPNRYLYFHMLFLPEATSFSGPNSNHKVFNFDEIKTFVLHSQCNN